MNPEDFERRTFEWVHPEAALWRSRLPWLLTTAVLVMFWAVLGAAVYGDALNRPLGARPERVDCFTTPQICEDRLPVKLTELPSRELVRSEAEKRVLRAFVAWHEIYGGETAPPSSVGALEQTLLEDARVRGNAAMWSENLSNTVIAQTGSVELPDDPQWTPWITHLADLAADREAATYASLVEQAKDQVRDQIQLESTLELAAWEAHRTERQLATASYAGLGLAGVLVLALLFVRHRVQSTQPFEVAVERHSIDVRGRRIPLSALTEADLLQLVHDLGAAGHTAFDRRELLGAIQARIHAASAGERPSPAARAALTKLLLS